MSTALYRKWRSQNFDEVVGQEHVTRTLQNALRDGRVAHAYLFSGPRGTGKTSTARILAKALNCTAPEGERPCNRCAACQAITEGRMIDLIEIDAASNNSVDDIRELRDKVSFRPSEGRFKVYIIDEVHMLTGSAFNALLKTLEEPPPHARFILATTEPHKIPATVISRCQRFDFRRIPAPEIAQHLQHIVAAEGFDAEPDALLMIGRSAQGCMRDAVSLLDQMLSFGSDRVTLAQVQQVLGAVNTQAVVDFVGAIAARDARRGLALVHKLMTDGASLTEFCHQVVEQLRAVMVLQMTNDAGLLDDLPTETVQQMQMQAKQMELPTTLYAIKRFSTALNELKGGFQPQLPLEMALIEVVQGEARAPAAMAMSAPAAGAAAPSTPARGEAKPTLANGTAISDAPVQEKKEPVALDAETARRLWTRWREFLAVVKTQCGQQAAAALNAVRDVAVAEHSVAFAFGNNEFSRNLIAKPDVLPGVAAALSRFIDRDVSIECQIGEKAILTGQVVTVHTAATDGPDPLVEFAIKDLGAQVAKAGGKRGASGRKASPAP
ncbi:MAG TPA: DNA polymerase III subunit gamma/tau [Chloroflexi bacterium]|nr:DNA polymerase III subunit gamma/tau [Chloroflexota bacterium]HHW86033.1 DNA polymerase III subunit gamma/tau [Chloroflexota bacterium]